MNCPEKTPDPFFSRQKKTPDPFLWDMVLVGVVVAVAVGLLVDFTGLPLRSLGARHAAAAREFYRAGDFFHPRFNHQPWAGKPVLGLWLVAAPMWVTGPTDRALALTSEVMAVSLVVLAYAIGRGLFGRGAGFFAGLVMAVNLVHGWVVRYSLLDTGSLVLLTVTMMFAYLAWTDERRRTHYVFLFYIGSALATMYRGPVGVLLPAAAVVTLLVPLGQWRVLGKFLNPWAMGLWLALVVPYYWAMGPEFFRHFFLHENVEHYLNGEPGGVPRPPWFFPGALLWRWLPWSLFTLLAFVHAYGKRWTPDGGKLWFLAVWFGSWFVIWTMAGARNETYTLVPGAPIALFTGYVLSALWSRPEDVVSTPARRIWLVTSFVIMVIACTCLPIVVLHVEEVGHSRGVWEGVTAGLCVWGLAVITLALKKAYRPALVVGSSMAVATGLIMALVVAPMRDGTKMGAELLRQVGGSAGDRQVIVFGKLAKEERWLGEVLYIDSPRPVLALKTREEVVTRWGENPDRLILTTEKQAGELSDLVPPARTEVLEDSSGKYVLFTPRIDE